MNSDGLVLLTSLWGDGSQCLMEEDGHDGGDTRRKRVNIDGKFVGNQ